MPSSWLSTPSARRLRPGWAQVEQLLNGADGARAVSKVLQSPLVQSLREQQAEVERQAAELDS